MSSFGSETLLDGSDDLTVQFNARMIPKMANQVDE
jgi:hypothetical protein